VYVPYLDHISVIASAVGYSEFCARGVRREIGAVWLAVGDGVLHNRTQLGHSPGQRKKLRERAIT
jgi:hypothetical protein